MVSFLNLFRLWASKHLSGFCPIGHIMKIWKFPLDRGCPCCVEDDETTMHFLICPNDGMQLTWDMNETRDYLLPRPTTPPPLTRPALHGLFLPLIHAAATAQDRFGWRNFVEGKISTEWRILQSRHYLEIGSRRSGDRWAEKLVTTLRSMWTYCNSVLHERDKDDLKIRDGAALAAAVNEQFVLGHAGLARRDRHFMNRGHENVAQLPVADVGTTRVT